MHLVWTLFWLALGVLLAVVGVRLLGRRRFGRGRQTVLDDEAVRRILQDGRLVTDEDEPLDLEGIQEEERRFWAEEEWDEAEEW